ncbi:hypothetical protein FA15DRAFT_338647 [Coprinopsis marcescibilis]|uniref:Methyltransferase-domain-containing protein n=1 Tax=Coprinopsis marcescibilis TaxID=230819 RepID=A0A5C3KYV8_COPMA|nr:hypothetical protein FA15DRAFT_338647 [Coprinopsis marcescibilis]
MFFYLSFLRPPPIRARLSSPVLITPQISNDLRTEPFESVQDIFYSWVLDDGSGQAQNVPRGIQPATATTKLTTYRQATAYKEIPVPVPKGAREGQSWRLVLTATAASASSTAKGHELIELGKADVGLKTPLPVISMPILFTVKAGRSGQKQEQIERVYRFVVPAFPTVDLDKVPAVGDAPQPNLLTPTPTMQQVSLKVREQTSFDLDKKIWDSGIALSSWLVRLGQTRDAQGQLQTEWDETNLGEGGKIALQRLKDVLVSEAPQKVLELGAGTGIVSLALGVLLSSRRPSDENRVKDEVLTTDLESAMPLLEHNISLNEHLFPSVSLRAVVLDWDEDLNAQLRDEAGEIDLVVMADVTYNTASFPALVQTIQKVIKANEKTKRPPILLGYKQRDEAERALWDMAKAMGVDFVKIGEVHGYGGDPNEIWIA